MADYSFTSNSSIIIRSDGAWIPVDEQNNDYIVFTQWLNANNTPDPYVAPPDPVPQSISDRQFFQQLSIVGIITEDQALASNAAVIPPPLLALIEALPADQQFAAKMLVSGATIFERHHPITEAIGQAYGWTVEQIDGFFTAASLL